MDEKVEAWLKSIHANELPDPPDLGVISLGDLHEARTAVEDLGFLKGESWTSRSYLGRGRRYNSRGGLHTFLSPKTTEAGERLEVSFTYRRLNGGLSCKEVESE